MINLIKNKLRAAGQRDPMVMAVDACEETDKGTDKEFLKKIRSGAIENQITRNMSDKEYKKHLKKTGNLKDLKKEPYSYKHHSDDKYKDTIKSYDDGIKKKTKSAINEDEKKKIETMIKTKKMNGKDLTPEQLQGLDAGLTQGGNPSVLNPPKPETKKDATPKPKPGQPGGGPYSETGKPTLPKTRKPKYNPYGPGTANPSNMSTSTGP